MTTTWNPFDISTAASVTLSNGNLTASNSGTSDRGVRSTTGRSSGIVAFEGTVVAGTGLFGICTSAMQLDASFGGVSWGITQNGANISVFSQSGAVASVAGTMAVNDVWTVIADLTGLRFYALRNGVNFFGNFLARTGGVTITAATYFAWWTSQGGAPDTGTGKFSALKYLQAGSLPWDDAVIAKAFYPISTAAATPAFAGSLVEADNYATAAANSAYGWTPGTQAIATLAFYKSHLGATAASATAQSTTLLSGTAPAKGTGSGAATAGDFFITPFPYLGTFASAAWTFAWNMRAGVAGAIGHINMRVWKSSNADASSATQITSATQNGATVTLSTTADVNSSISWSPGAIYLNNEYLVFQIEWQETTTGTSATDNVFFRLGTAKITTPTFTPLAIFMFPRNRHYLRR